MKEGKVVVCGDYSEVVKTGFNIKDILDSFNKALSKKKIEKEWTEKCKVEDAPKWKAEKEWAEKCKPEDAPYIPEEEWTDKCPVPG